jgi:hypothetical protein
MTSIFSCRLACDEVVESSFEVLVGLSDKTIRFYPVFSELEFALGPGCRGDATRGPHSGVSRKDRACASPIGGMCFEQGVQIRTSCATTVTGGRPNSDNWGSYRNLALFCSHARLPDQHSSLLLTFPLPPVASPCAFFPLQQELFTPPVPSDSSQTSRRCEQSVAVADSSAAPFAQACRFVCRLAPLPERAQTASTGCPEDSKEATRSFSTTASRTAWLLPPSRPRTWGK